MKVGMSLFGVQARKYPIIAKKAEEAGFESCWMPEHLIMPTVVPPKYPYTADGYPPITPKTQMYDPWITLAYVAAATEKINLGTQVFILPLRHPIYTARQVATLDMLSNGRVLLGCGIGWMPQEFEYVGLGWKDRTERTTEIVEVLKKLWTREVIEHHGKFFNFGPVRFEPKPTRRPHPPILFGGTSEPALRRTGQLGDGWLGHRHTVEEAGQMIARINWWRKEFGRDQGAFEFTTPLKTDNGVPPTLDQVKRMEEVGVTRAMVTPWEPPQGRLTIDHMLAGIESYGTKVIAKLG